MKEQLDRLLLIKLLMTGKDATNLEEYYAAKKACKLIIDHNLDLSPTPITPPKKVYKIPKLANDTLKYNMQCAECNKIIKIGSNYYFLNELKYHTHCIEEQKS